LHLVFFFFFFFFFFYFLSLSLPFSLFGKRQQERNTVRRVPSTFPLSGVLMANRSDSHFLERLKQTNSFCPPASRQQSGKDLTL
jgi:hypothetical protein